MDSTTQPPEHNEDDDFPAPPMGTTGMMLTPRQRRRIKDKSKKDKSKKEAIAKTSVQSKEALQKLLHLRLTENARCELASLEIKYVRWSLITTWTCDQATMW